GVGRRSAPHVGPPGPGRAGEHPRGLWRHGVLPLPRPLALRHAHAARDGLLVPGGPVDHAGDGAAHAASVRVRAGGAPRARRRRRAARGRLSGGATVGRASAIAGQENSSRVSLQFARVRPSGVLQAESSSTSVRNCACSDPTTLPSASYMTTGAVPTAPIVPSAYLMGGNPVAVARNGVATKQDMPGSSTPRKVSLPVHPSPPPSPPVPVNFAA